jgi:hypothetical protein
MVDSVFDNQYFFVNSATEFFNTIGGLRAFAIGVVVAAPAPIPDVRT